MRVGTGLWSGVGAITGLYSGAESCSGGILVNVGKCRGNSQVRASSDTDSGFRVDSDAVSGA